MPADGRAFELLRLLLGEQLEIGECVNERGILEFAQRHLGGPEVALLDRSGEASVCAALRGHEQMFARAWSTLQEGPCKADD